MIWVGVALVLLGVAAAQREPRRPANGVAMVLGAVLIAGELLGRTMRGLQTVFDPMAAAWLLLGLAGAVLLLVLVLGLFCVYNGVVMLRRERRAPAHLLSLVTGLGLLALVAAGAVTVLTNNQWQAVVLLLALPAAGYLSLLFCAFVLYSALYARMARASLGDVAAVIVLGAGLAGDRVTPLLAGRLALGERVYREARATRPVRIVTSGGQGPGETVPEAVAMRRWLVERGVPEDDVLTEDRSTTTRENLLLSRQVLADAGVEGPVVAVSSDYHAMRAATLLRDLGLEGQAVGARTARYYWPSAVIREYVAWLRDHLVVHLVVVGLLLTPLVLFALFALGRLVTGR
jgi:uncharacterized SAM-binding protein YcdF (DUF218 family)